MFDIKRAHVLEAIAELAQTAGLPNAELEALKAMKQMKDELEQKIGEKAADKVFEGISNE
jgi:2-hydroxychromene-2-carboxylate isomerase